MVCNKTWRTWQGFVADPDIQVVGLQAVPSVPRANVLVFLHKGCGSISVKTSTLRDLMGEPGSSNRDRGLENEPCDGCFRDLEDLAKCQKACVIAGDRRLTLELLKKKS